MEVVTLDAVELFSTHDKWCAAYLLALRLQLARTVLEQRSGTPWIRFDFHSKAECEQHWNDYRSGKGSIPPGALRTAFYAVQGEMRNAQPLPEEA